MASSSSSCDKGPLEEGEQGYDRRREKRLREKENKKKKKVTWQLPPLPTGAKDELKDYLALSPMGKEEYWAQATLLWVAQDKAMKETEARHEAEDFAAKTDEEKKEAGFTEFEGRWIKMQ